MFLRSIVTTLVIWFCSLLTPSIMADAIGDENEKVWLKNDVLSTDYAGLFQSLGIVVLDDIKTLKSGDYYTYLDIVKVMESHKDDLPEYIFIKGNSEYTPQDALKNNLKQYTLLENNKGSVFLMALCKGKGHYYAPETHSSFRNTETLRAIAKETGKAVSTSENACTKPHVLAQ